MGRQNNSILSASFEEEATFTLVSNLLAELLTDPYAQLVITARAEDFIYDATTTVEVGEPCTLRVASTHAAEIGVGAEFSITGEIAIRKGLNYNFSLYFFLEKNNLSLTDMVTRPKLLKDQTVLISVQTSPATLHDALFSLELRWGDLHGPESLTAEGRGYLAFVQGSGEKIILEEH